MSERHVYEELAAANAQAKRRKLESRKLTEELNKLRSEHEKAVRDLERLRRDPSALQQEVDKLRGELRSRDHREVFNRVGKELGVKDAALGDLWTLSGYKAETDEVDADALKDVVGALVKDRPYFLADKEAKVDKVEAKPAQLQPGPGLGKGASADPTRFNVRKSDLQDPEWVRANQAKIAEHTINKTINWIEG